MPSVFKVNAEYFAGSGTAQIALPSKSAAARFRQGLGPLSCLQAACLLAQCKSFTLQHDASPKGDLKVCTVLFNCEVATRISSDPEADAADREATQK